MEVFLYNSTVCRLCGEENDNGTLLYSCEENNQNLSELVNTFLPLKVTDDGLLPRTICPGCTIQLDATVEFLNLIINGQKIIRELYQREKEYKKSQQICKEEEIITEKIVYETPSNGILYTNEHPASLQVEGLDKPKRKRGRPPKKAKPVEEEFYERIMKQHDKIVCNNTANQEPNGKRRRKTPNRYKDLEVIQGKELDRIFKEEGMTDGEESDGESRAAEAKVEPKPPSPPLPKEPEVIGHLQDSGELVVVTKGKGRGRPKGRLRQIRQECAICGMEFSCVGRYMSHVAQHGPVLYQCSQCQETFTTRLRFNAHQRDSEHTGQNIIQCDSDEVKQTVEIQEPPAPEQAEVSAGGSLPDLSVPMLKEEVIEPLEVVFVPETETPDDAIDILSQPTEPHNEVVIADVPEPDATQEKPDVKDKGKLKCTLCDKLFSSKQSRSLHIKASHHGERPYACGECGATFGYPRSLALHSLSHRRQKAAPAKGYACDLCGKVLNHPSSVVYHKEAEHAGQRYVCNKCGKWFKHKQLLQRHQLVHSQLRPYTCKTCDATFKTKANMVNHQLLHTGVKRYSCEICKHKFAHKTSLTLHMRWHTGHKPYSCGKCGKSFSQKGNLSEHERIHTGEKPFSCGLCSRRFTTSSQHRLHARRHLSERPYVCGNCGKRFATRGSWAAHQRREAGARAHRCGVCARAFSERWALLKHMRRHTGERPFRCPHCPRAFADCSNLNKHKKQVHKQMSLLVSEQAGAVEVEQESAGAEEEQRVIYVAYDYEASSPRYHVIDPEQLYAAEGAASPPPVAAPCSPPPPQPVTDEAGNPLQFTMEDGTQLAITMGDGKSLQIITQDGQTIPVEINGFIDETEEVTEDTIPYAVHQLDVQKDVDSGDSSSVTHYFTIV